MQRNALLIPTELLFQHDVYGHTAFYTRLHVAGYVQSEIGSSIKKPSLRRFFEINPYSYAKQANYA
jgi:hypothetical protein